MKKIKRTIYHSLIKHLDHREITMIMWPRQVGKTTIMNEMSKSLSSQWARVLRLNLDIETDAVFFESQIKLLQKISLEFGSHNGYIFIDEIQKKENAWVFLKWIYDMNLGHKFIISGSGSIELKEKIHESLAGRKRVFEMNPVSFLEFINFKTHYKYESNIPLFAEVQQSQLKILLNEYLNFGGYPQVILAETTKEKILIIDEIYKSYILKDISYLLNIDKPEKYSLLLKIIATQIGQPIKYSELAKQVGINESTIKNYLYYATHTYFIKICQPYHTNLQKEILKSPMIYFNDIWMRNYMLGLFWHLNEQDNLWLLFQNFIHNILLQKYDLIGEYLKFWRTVDGWEIDLIVDRGRDIIPVEVKYINYVKPETGKSVQNFINKYHPKQLNIINLTLKQSITKDDTIINFVPYRDIL